ncbi:MAG: hypothetical protein EB120_13260 [Proteobacteria bacterium]|nr:hypothetical protein [Pseudomonadota bacterium]
MKIQLKELANQGVRIPKAATHYYDKLVPMVYSQGPLGFWGVIKKLFVFFLGLKKPISREPSSISDMKIWATKSTALACENLMLSLRASGYDSCPLEGIDSKRIRKLLGLPGQVLIPMVIAIGKRRSDGVTLPRIRADKSWFVREV